MILLCITAAIILLFALIPCIRIFIKRIILTFKLRRQCKETGARLVPHGSFWWLGGKHGESWDFAIEKEHEILIVKLFAMKKRSDVLYFIKGGSYMIRKHLALMARIGIAAMIPLDSDIHALKNYDFRKDAPEGWYTKPQRKILLIHPTCHEIRLKISENESPYLGAGDTVEGMEIYSLSRLLGILR